MTKRNNKGRNNPNFGNKKGITIMCRVCKKPIYVIPSDIGKRKYCSQQCFRKVFNPMDSKESREKLSNLRKGENNPFYGKKPSEETKKKLSFLRIGKPSGRLGKKHTNEWKEEHSELLKANYFSGKTIAYWKGKVLSESHRSNIGKAGIGRIHSEESKKKMSKSGKLSYLSGNRKLGGIFDTSIELIMENALCELNVYYIKQYPIIINNLFTKPDFFLPDHNVIIECDGDYWHNRKDVKKIDKLKDFLWASEGYKVIRFWEHNIHNSINDCIEELCSHLN